MASKKERMESETGLGDAEESETHGITKQHTDHVSASTILQGQKFHQINPNRWFGLFRGYIRQDWETIYEEEGIDELRANWGELFFDLIFVAAIVHLSSEATYSLPSDDESHRRLAGVSTGDDEYSTSYCYDAWEYGFVVCCFGQFAILTNWWRKQVLYITHFVMNQWIDDVIRCGFMLSVLSMGIFIRDDPDYHYAFLQSYQFLNFFNILMFLKAFLIPRAKWHALWEIFASLFFILASLIIQQVARNSEVCAMGWFTIYFGIFVVETFFAYFGQGILVSFGVKPSPAIPLNVPHIAERYGLFIMLILGESLISIMGTDIGELNLGEPIRFEDGAPPRQILIVFVFVTFLMAYIIGKLYYDCQPPEEIIMEERHTHALRVTRQTARMYLYAHQLLFFALLGFGMGAKIAGKHLFGEKRYWIDVVLPGYSLVIIVWALNTIRLSHPPYPDGEYTDKKGNHHFKRDWVWCKMKQNPKVWIFRTVIVVIMSIVPAFATTINQGAIFLILFLCLFSLQFADIEGKNQRRKAKEELKERRMAAMENGQEDSKEQRMNAFKRQKTVGKL